MGIICERKVLQITFFAVVCEKTLTIQAISNSSQDKKSKKTFANASRFAKFTNVFFHRQFPLYGTSVILL